MMTSSITMHEDAPTMNRSTICAALALLPMTACAPPSVDQQAEVAALREAATAYHEAASAKRADDVVAMYDAEPMMVPPNADMVDGLEGVQDYRFGFIETPGVELSFEIIRAEVSSAGDMGWTLSLGEITINRPTGPPGRDLVRDFHTWKKQVDGSWKVVVDMWNSGMPAG
jgi:ketosteroid isomerase-like protein